MHARYKQVLESLQRVVRFTDAHSLEAPGYGEPGMLLAQSVSSIATQAAAAAEARRQAPAETARLRERKKVLREQHLRPLAMIAKVVARTVPGVEIALRIPKAGWGVTRLLAEAQAIRDAVGPHEAQFILGGRPADFLAQLDRAIALVVESVARRTDQRRFRTGASKAVREEARRGMDAVIMLDTIVRTRFAGSPDVLAEWKNARRVHLPRGGRVATDIPATGVEVPRQVA